MKNKIAVNTKYFKRSQAKGIRAHVKRDFAEDKNVIDPKLTANNFGMTDAQLDGNYEKALKIMPQSVQNSLIDSVLVLPLEQFEEVRKNNPNGWKKEIHNSIIGMMKEMEQDSGFMPLGYKVHLDEGHVDPKTGKTTLNPHAHLHFANVCAKDITLKKTKKVTQKDANGKALRDPKKPSKYLYKLTPDGNVMTEEVEIKLKGRAPLSLHQTRGKNSVWARQQDIAAKHLKHLGFERGESKELTNAKHLEKNDYLGRVSAEKQALIDSQNQRLNELSDTIKMEEKKVDDFISQRDAYFEGLKQGSVLGFDGKMDKAIAAVETLPEATQAVAFENSANKAKEVKSSIKFEDSFATDHLQGFINSMESKASKAKTETPKRKSGMKL